MKQKFERGKTVAVNMTSIVNRPETFDLIMQVGPKMCTLTASHPGFVGFMALYQVGILPLAGRYGGASTNMSDKLNPIKLWQYSIWDSPDAHEEWHYEYFENFFELCGRCLGVVIEGPWEPVYDVVDVDLPPLMTMSDVPSIVAASAAKQEPVPKVRLQHKRMVVLGDHWVMEGHEGDFEKGAIETLSWLKEHAPGMIGWMILKQIGVCAIGSFQLAPDSLMKALTSLGANPPKYKTNYGDTWKTQRIPPIPAQNPPQYFVHTEWESEAAAHSGLAHTLISPTLRKIHNEGVLAHVIKGPYYIFFNPMMEEAALFV